MGAFGIWIPSGLGGTKKTIEKMSTMVRQGKKYPDIIEAASEITFTCPPKNKMCEAASLFEWVRDNIRYVMDPTPDDKSGKEYVELVKAPWVTLRHRAGDCDDQCVLLNSLCEAIGIRTGFETVKASAQNPDEFSHVYSIIKTPNGWRAADPTMPEAYLGWRPSRVFGRKQWII